MNDSAVKVAVPSFKQFNLDLPCSNETQVQLPGIGRHATLMSPMQDTRNSLPLRDTKSSQPTHPVQREASWESHAHANESRLTRNLRRETSWESHEKLEVIEPIAESSTPRAILPQIDLLAPANFHVSPEDKRPIISDSTCDPSNTVLPSICEKLSSTILPEQKQAPLLQRFSSLVTSSSEISAAQPVMAQKAERPRSAFWSTVMIDRSSPPQPKFAAKPSIIDGSLRRMLLLRPALGIVKIVASAPSRNSENVRQGVDTVSTEHDAPCGTSPDTSLSFSRTSSREREEKKPMPPCDTGNLSPGAITVKPFTCRGCKVRFESRSDLASHSPACGSNSSSRPFVCNHCGASFHKNSNLVKHISLVELKLRPFKCTLCDATFGQKSNLSSHIRVTHHGERKYVCPEPNCGRRFGQNSGLRAHVRTVHLGARDFVCDCERRFGSRGDLNRHIRSAHQKLLPFPCITCGKAFSRKSVLQRHRAAVHKEDVSVPQK